MLGEFEQVLNGVLSWHGATVRARHDELQFFAGRQTLGTLRWDGRLDVRLPARLRTRLVAEGVAAHDPPGDGRSRGAVWFVRTAHDAQHAVWLLRLAYLLAREDRRAASSAFSGRTT